METSVKELEGWVSDGFTDNLGLWELIAGKHCIPESGELQRDASAHEGDSRHGPNNPVAKTIPPFRKSASPRARRSPQVIHG